MIESTRWNYHVRLFDSVEDLIESASAAPSANMPNVRAVSINRESFVGRDFSDWSEMYAAARAPWPEGVEIVEAMAADLAGADMPRPVSRKRRLRWSDDSGDEVDYDRLRGGSDYWRASHRATVRGPEVVTLVIDVNAAANVKHRDILWRGAAALAMTRILEDADFRVEIWIAHRADECYSDGWGHFHAVCLKRSGDPLDVSTLVPATSGWFYRSLMFRAKGIGSKVPKKGLGSPYPPSCLVEEITRGEVVTISGTYTRDGAIYLAQEALKRLVTPPTRPEPESEVVPTIAATAEPARPVKVSRAEIRRREKEYARAVAAWKKSNVEGN